MMRAITEREQRAREWFADHVVSAHTTLRDPDGREVEYLRWRRPRDSMYSVTYLRLGNGLFVTGDLGDAVYRWGGASPKTLAWIAKCDVGYFASKCHASPHGRDFRTWDEREAARQVEHWLAERDEWADCRQEDCSACGGTGVKPGTTEEEDEPCEAEGCGLGLVDVPLPSEARRAFEAHDGRLSLTSRHEWSEWLREHGEALYGADWCGFCDVGEVIDGHCVAHLVGLKMAAERIETGEAAA